MRECCEQGGAARKCKSLNRKKQKTNPAQRPARNLSSSKFSFLRASCRLQGFLYVLTCVAKTRKRGQNFVSFCFAIFTIRFVRPSESRLSLQRNLYNNFLAYSICLFSDVYPRRRWSLGFKKARCKMAEK